MRAALRHAGIATLVVGAIVAPLTAAASTRMVDSAEEFFTVRDRRLVEISGMAAGSTPGVLFVHEDAGRPATVYALDPNGRVRLVVDVPGVENLDWEDIALGTDDDGRPALFVADVGNAWATRRGTDEPPRTTFALVRFAEPVVVLEERLGVLPAEVDAQDVVSYKLQYADGAARNAEALAIQPGTNRVLVVDKVGDEGRQAHLWIAPKTLDPAAPNLLTRLAQVPVTGASGAAFSPTGDLLAVRNGTTAYVWRVSEDLHASVATDPVNVALPEQQQGESITFSADGRSLLVGSEGREQPVWSVPLPDGLAPAPESPAPEPSVAESSAPASPSAAAAWPWAVTGAGALGAVLFGLHARRRRA